jgi:ArsR family transcriptional regulator
MNSDRNSHRDVCCTEDLTFARGKADAIAGQLKALAHPVRLQILQHLGNAGKCCCNDFCASIPLAQSTISQHLKILCNAGIIDYQPAGNCSHYSLKPEALEEAMQALAQIRQFAIDISRGELSNRSGRTETAEVSPKPDKAQSKAIE